MSITNNSNTTLNIFTMTPSNGWSVPFEVSVNFGQTIILPSSDSGEYVVSSADKDIGKIYIPLQDWFGSSIVTNVGDEYYIRMGYNNCFFVY
jgi:hypothetical protein